MKTKLGIVAVLLIVIGFGMVHEGSRTMQVIAISLMGIGIGYLLYLFLSKRKKGPQNPPGGD